MSRLLMGAAKEDVTPAVGCRLFGYGTDTYAASVHDPLYAKAFYITYGESSVLVISADVCEIDVGVCTALRQKLSQQHALPVSHVLICPTHTHSGPALAKMDGWGDVDLDYLHTVFEPRVLRAAQRAAESREPVQMGVASGKSRVGVNRREPNGKGGVKLGVWERGCYDPEMVVLSFRNEARQIVANMIHYGCHGTCAGNNTEISRDWPGVMTDRLEELSGGVTAFLNGAEGDVGPRLTNRKTTGDIRYMQEHGGVAARDAADIFRAIRSYRDVDMAFASHTLHIPLAERISLSEAKAGEAAYLQYQQQQNWRYAQLQYYRNVAAAWENDLPQRACIEVEQAAVRIGDAVLIAFPYELFSEIGLKIKARSAIPYTMPLSMVSGSLGYFPTEEQRCKKGYEVRMFEIAQLQPYAPFADEKLVSETVELLEKL